jgi:hypothetical protein
MNADNCQSTSSDSRYRVPACWLVLIILNFCLMAFAFAQESPSSGETRPVQVTEIRISGPQDVNNNAIRFEAIDVFVDSGDQHLAAWQLELASRTKDVEIVGIEGGEHRAFEEN